MTKKRLLYSGEAPLLPRAVIPSCNLTSPARAVAELALISETLWYAAESNALEEFNQPEQ